MKRSTIIMSCAVLFLLLTAETCTQEQTADQKAQKQQEVLLQEANRQVGMPNIINFRELKIFKSIQELCDQMGLITYSYTFCQYTGKLSTSVRLSAIRFPMLHSLPIP